MNIKKRYDEIINFIESAVNEGFGKKAIDIADKLIKEKGQGVSLRDFGAIIGFMTGEVLISYIKSRQMVRAYKSLVEDGQSIDTAINYTGLGDQPAFIKAFRRQFDMTPTEAVRAKNLSYITLPQTWSVISEENHTTKVYESDEDEYNMKGVMKFGIAANKLDLIREVIDLQSVYGFSDDQAEFAFSIVEKYKYDVRKVFDFVDDYYLQSEEFDIYKTQIDLRTQIESDSLVGGYAITGRTHPDNALCALEPLIYAYFTFNMLSINFALDLINDLDIAGIDDITKEDAFLIDFYLSSDFNDYMYSDLRDYYIAYKEKYSSYTTFDDFMVGIGLGFHLDGVDGIDSINDYIFDDIYKTTQADIDEAKKPTVNSIWLEDENGDRTMIADDDFYDDEEDDDYYDELRDDNKDYFDSFSDDS